MLCSVGTAPLVGRRGSSALGLSPLRGQDRPVIGYLCVERLLGPEATWLGRGQMQCGCGPASQVEIVHIPLELGVLGFLCSLGLRLSLQGRCGFDSPRYLAQLSVWANSFYLFIFNTFVDVFFGPPGSWFAAQAFSSRGELSRLLFTGLSGWRLPSVRSAGSLGTQLL